MAPFPVDPSGGDGRGCARLGAGGTPALPPDARAPRKPSSHDIVTPRARRSIVVWRLWLKEVYLFSGLFVLIRHSWFVFINDQPFFLE